MTELVQQQETKGALTIQELNALQSLAMLPLQQVAAKVTLTLPFERLAMLLRALRHNLALGRPAAYETPIIHFVSPHKADGADVIAFEMAYVAATQTGKRVLFINTTPNSQLVSRQLAEAASHSGQLVPHDDAYAPFSGVEGASFFFTTISAPGSHERLLPDARDFKKILEDLRKMFDLVVIHSDLALSSQMALTLFGLTDGGVIVARAEHTRVPVIKQLRNVIETQGGRVIGVVLNKRKFYIPSKLYSFLFRTAE